MTCHKLALFFAALCLKCNWRENHDFLFVSFISTHHWNSQYWNTVRGAFKEKALPSPYSRIVNRGMAILSTFKLHLGVLVQLTRYLHHKLDSFIIIHLCNRSNTESFSICGAYYAHNECSSVRYDALFDVQRTGNGRTLLSDI